VWTWNKQKGPVSRFAAIEELWQDKLRCSSSHQSLLFFTVHKAASSFAAQLLHRIARDHEICTLDYDGYLRAVGPNTADQALRPTLEAIFHSDQADDSDDLQSRLNILFQPQGCLYAPIRRPTLLASLKQLDRFQSIVLLRDPRDCLTSLYFSIAYSHRPPENSEAREQFFAHREEVRQREIDEFVLSEAPHWMQRYTQYCKALHEHPHVHLLTYEQLVLDFPSWLDRLSEIWGLTFSRRLRNRLMNMASFDVKSEDIYSHKRQVLPGDHRRKLQPDTIRQVTELFRPVLEPLGYSVDTEGSQAA
jgi:hypothetical protein